MFWLRWAGMVRFDCAPLPPPWGRKVATVSMTAGKSLQIWYDTPCPALEAALHAQPIIWYFAVPFGRPLSFACAIHMYTQVGVKFAPLWCIPVLPMGTQGCCSGSWCGARVRVWLPVVCLIVPCLAGYLARVLVPQCGVWRLGWLGSWFRVGGFRLARRAGLGLTLPCSPAGAGGFAGPV